MTPHRAETLSAIAVGGLAGLTWAAALRAWMVQLAGAESTFTWYGTFGAILAPGVLVGALLGWSVARRVQGVVRGRGWLIVAPWLLVVPTLAIPGAIAFLVTTGLGSGGIGLVMLGQLGGFALSGGGHVALRAVAGVVAASPVAALLVVPGLPARLDPSTPQGAWSTVLLAALIAVLALGCSQPMRPVRPSGRHGEEAEPSVETVGLDPGERRTRSASPYRNVRFDPCG